ncbi:MAG TPA: C40 family peptidase [Actinomycetota bacterium]|nr:C40 family peptidase [Actinomycetota bacterium]
MRARILALTAVALFAATTGAGAQTTPPPTSQRGSATARLALTALAGVEDAPSSQPVRTAAIGFELAGSPAPEPIVQAAPPPPPAPTPAEIAIATAHHQLGKPYRYGSTGPNSFDCSGFTSYVWRAAGVELPRTSRAQFSGLPRVPLDQMQPGDLVYSPGHIGMYLGDGMMIHSPRTGRHVEISPLHKNIIGAVRPG